MNGKEVDAALKRASRNKTGSTPTPEDVEKYLRSYKSNLFPTKIRMVMKEKLHVKNENGYIAYYNSLSKILSLYALEFIHIFAKQTSSKFKFTKTIGENNKIDKKNTHTF